MGLFKSNKHYKVRTGARSTSKVQEKDLVRKARLIGKNPELVLPICAGRCRICPLAKVRKRIMFISKYRDDVKKLRSLSRKGDKISRAYAGTLALVHTDTSPFMGLFKTPFGQIPFAVVGQTDQRKLIGIQHYDHKEYRLMAYLEIAEKKHIYIYSTRDGMICTGSKPSPPEGFVKGAVSELKIGLKERGGVKNVFTSRHLKSGRVKDDTQSRIPYLKITWKSAGALVAVDEVTLRNQTTHTLGRLAALIAGPDVRGDFDVEVMFRPECKEGSGKCLFSGLESTDESLYKEYRDYKLNDHMLVRRQYDNIMESYSSSGEDILLYDGYCFSGNLSAFFEQTGPSDLERPALEAVLKRVKSPKLFKKKPSLMLVLSEYWEDYGYWALVAVSGDKKVSRKLHSEGGGDAGEIGELLRQAREVSAARAVIEQLPRYGKGVLPPEALIADRTAKKYKGNGRDTAVKFLDEQNPENPQARSTMYAFLLNLEATAGRQWKFTDEQRDVGKFLEPFTRKILDSEPGEYHEALKTLLMYTGYTEKIEPIR